MYCPSCGTDLPANARFCGNCRHEISPASHPAEPQQHTQQMDPAAVHIVGGNTPPAEVAPHLKWGVIVASLVLPVIGIVMGLVYLLGDASAEKKSVGKLWLIVGVIMAVVWMLASMDSGTIYY